MAESADAYFGRWLQSVARPLLVQLDVHVKVGQLLAPDPVLDVFPVDDEPESFECRPSSAARVSLHFVEPAGSRFLEYFVHQFASHTLPTEVWMDEEHVQQAIDREIAEPDNFTVALRDHRPRTRAAGVPQPLVDETWIPGCDLRSGVVRAGSAQDGLIERPPRPSGITRLVSPYD